MLIKDFVQNLNLTRATGLRDSARDRYRELIRQRDSWRCQLCGYQWIFGNRRLDVHHKDFVKEKTKQVDGNETMDNLITLCHCCHMNLSEHRKAMQKRPVDKSS